MVETLSRLDNHGSKLEKDYSTINMSSELNSINFKIDVDPDDNRSLLNASSNSQQSNSDVINLRPVPLPVILVFISVIALLVIMVLFLRCRSLLRRHLIGKQRHQKYFYYSARNGFPQSYHRPVGYRSLAVGQNPGSQRRSLMNYNSQSSDNNRTLLIHSNPNDSSGHLTGRNRPIKSQGHNWTTSTNRWSTRITSQKQQSVDAHQYLAAGYIEYYKRQNRLASTINSFNVLTTMGRRPPPIQSNNANAESVISADTDRERKSTPLSSTSSTSSRIFHGHPGRRFKNRPAPLDLHSCGSASLQVPSSSRQSSQLSSNGVGDHPSLSLRSFRIELLRIDDLGNDREHSKSELLIASSLSTKHRRRAYHHSRVKSRFDFASDKSLNWHLSSSLTGSLNSRVDVNASTTTFNSNISTPLTPTSQHYHHFSKFHKASEEENQEATNDYFKYDETSTGIRIDKSQVGQRIRHQSHRHSTKPRRPRLCLFSASSQAQRHSWNSLRPDQGQTVDIQGHNPHHRTNKNPAVVIVNLSAKLNDTEEAKSCVELHNCNNDASNLNSFTPTTTTLDSGSRPRLTTQHPFFKGIMLPDVYLNPPSISSLQSKLSSSPTTGRTGLGQYGATYSYGSPSQYSGLNSLASSSQTPLNRTFTASSGLSLLMPGCILPSTSKFIINQPGSRRSSSLLSITQSTDRPISCCPRSRSRPELGGDWLRGGSHSRASSFKRNPAYDGGGVPVAAASATANHISGFDRVHQCIKRTLSSSMTTLLPGRRNRHRRSPGDEIQAIMDKHYEMTGIRLTSNKDWNRNESPSSSGSRHFPLCLARRSKSMLSNNSYRHKGGDHSKLSHFFAANNKTDFLFHHPFQPNNRPSVLNSLTTTALPCIAPLKRPPPPASSN